MHAPSLTALLVILAIVVLIFGTRKLRNVGGDLGAAIRNFKTSMKEGENEAADKGAAVERKPGDPPQS